VNSAFNFTNGGFGADSVHWIQNKNMPLSFGYIALQAESHPIRFRKVELLNLEGCMDKKALNYKSYTSGQIIQSVYISNPVDPGNFWENIFLTTSVVCIISPFRYLRPKRCFGAKRLPVTRK
jgi:hypothetical protein